MRTFGLLLLALLTALPAAAQTPDTVAWRRYFPLAVGNVWEYVHEQNNPSGSWHERYAVANRFILEGDTLFSVNVYWLNTVTEAVVRDTLSVRYDDTTAAVVNVRTRSPALFPFGCGLNASGSGWWEAPRCFVFVHPLIDSSYYNPWRGRKGKYLGSYVYSGLWIADLGMVQGGGGCEPCGSLDFSEGWTLRYARIGGVEYGQRIVASETAERPEAAALRLWPNPSRGAVTVEAAPRAAVVAFDLLGREAVRTTAGADGRAALTLAPGVYVVAAGSQRQTLVVR